MKKKDSKTKQNWWSRHCGKIFWGSLPVCMIGCAVYSTSKNFCVKNLIMGLWELGPLLWLLIWVFCLLVWALLHLFDGDNHNNDRNSSSNEEPDSFTNWYICNHLFNG